MKQEFEATLAQAKEEEAQEAPEQVSASDQFHQGVALFDRGDYTGALPRFRLSRETDPAPLPPWLYELRTFKKQGDRKSAKETAELFLKNHSDSGLRSIPLVEWAIGASP